ncbi:MAG: hypothetical protein EU541_08400 [Promethearchaeota archaeon]|nr:MAG: hypothetical protein EU541_08400 [Candidatus Lokiarchaeota archaeon]
MKSKVKKGILFSFLISFIIFIVGISISYTLTYLIPGDPALIILPDHFTAEEYLAAKKELGLDQPLFLQILLYIFKIIIGNWGPAILGNTGEVSGVIFLLIPRLIFRMMNPLVISICLGLIIEIYLRKIKARISKNIVLSIIFLVFSLSFIILASFVYLNLYLARDFLNFISSTIIFIPIIILFSYYKPKNKDIINDISSNSIFIFLAFNLIFSFYFLNNFFFYNNGYSSYLFLALAEYDFYTLNSLIIIIIITQAIIIFVSNLLLIYTKHSKKIDSEDSEAKNEKSQKNEIINNFNSDEKRLELSKKEKIKSFIKIPSSFIGILFLFILVTLIILTPFLAQHSRQDILTSFTEFYNLSLSQMLALILYGLQDSLLFGFLSLIVSLIIGSIFGFLIQGIGMISEKTKNIFRIFIMLQLFPIYSICGILMIILLGDIYMVRIGVIVFSISLFFAPLFTYYISKPKLKKNNLYKGFKKILENILILIPLIIGLAIILNNIVGALGYQGSYYGYFINSGIFEIYNAFFGILFLSLAIFLVSFPFFLIYEGLSAYFNNQKIEKERNLSVKKEIPNDS